MRLETVADIIKRRCKEAGFNPEEFGGHSLRAGFISTCSERGDSERDIMEQSRHKSLITFRGYIREAERRKRKLSTGL